MAEAFESRNARIEMDIMPQEQLVFGGNCSKGDVSTSSMIVEIFE